MYKQNEEDGKKGDKEDDVDLALGAINACGGERVNKEINWKIYM